MLGLEIGLKAQSPLKILCLGAHCDDIEIGCGGALLSMTETNPNITIHWVVFTSNKEREQEAKKSAEQFLKRTAGRTVVIKRFRDGFLPYMAIQVKEYFETVKHDFDPDLIFTHYGQDAHQDHRIVSELTWNTFRNHLILEYEIPKYDGDLGRPNFYIPISSETAHSKAELIISHFPSQTAKHWFEEETFLSIMRIRGMESPSEAKYSEAFYLRKAVLQNH